MPSASDTVTFNTLATLTFNNARERIFDNVFKKSVLCAKLLANGRIDRQNGGAKIQRSLEMAANGTVKSYSGYDPIDLTPQETATVALADWKEIAGSVVISRRERRINSGESAIANLLTHKIGNLERSFNEAVNSMLLNPTGTTFTAGNGGKDLTPLTAIIHPAATTVFGLAEATHTYWVPQRVKSASAASTALTLSGYKQELRNMHNRTGRNNDGFADLVLTSQAAYEKYEQALEGQVQYQQTSSANLGFETLRLKSAEMAWDQIVPQVTTNTTTLVAYDNGTAANEEVAFFINTEFLQFVVDSQTNMVMTPFQESQDQTASSAKMLFMGELICTNRRAQGVLYCIDTPSITG